MLSANTNRRAEPEAAGLGGNTGMLQRHVARDKALISFKTHVSGIAKVCAGVVFSGRYLLAIWERSFKPLRYQNGSRLASQDG